MASHVVEQGEYLAAIAKKYGFFDYRTIWDDPNNAELKSRRGSPNVLYPGDVVFIPDKAPKSAERPTTNLHQFKLKSHKVMLQLVLEDESGRPLANAKATLKVDGVSEALTADGDGMIRKPIPETAKGGSLVFGGVEIPLRIGHMDPVTERSGQTARLNNLGYDPGEDDDERFRSAVE